MTAGLFVDLEANETSVHIIWVATKKKTNKIASHLESRFRNIILIDFQKKKNYYVCFKCCRRPNSMHI